MIPSAAAHTAIAPSGRPMGETGPHREVGRVALAPTAHHTSEGLPAFTGDPHAEIAALRDAGERVPGGTPVVTRAHHGRTLPRAAPSPVAASAVGGRTAAVRPTRTAHGPCPAAFLAESRARAAAPTRLDAGPAASGVAALGSAGVVTRTRDRHPRADGITQTGPDLRGAAGLEPERPVPLRREK